MCDSIETSRPGHVPSDRVVDFDIYQPMQGGLDFYESWKNIQDLAPGDVVWTPRNGGHWLVLRGKLISQVLSDYRNFSSHTILVPKATAGEAYRVIPISLDPPEHRPFRKLLNEDLGSRNIRSIEGSIRTLTVQLIESFRHKGRCDFVKEFAQELPIRIFMQMVELPIEDMPRLKYLVDQFTRPDGSITYTEVNRLLHEYIEPVIADRRGKPGKDMISRMINSEINDCAMTDEAAASLCIQVLVGGLDTVLNFMSFVMIFLSQSTEHRHFLAGDPSRIPNAVTEMLRRFPLVTVGREVTHDMEYGGVQLKAGDMVMVPTILHGLDERENEDPMRVHFARSRARHSAFGSGSHTCPGAHLAQTEVRIMLEEWLLRIPEFGISPDARPTFTGGIVASVKPFSLTWDVSAIRGESAAKIAPVVPVGSLG